MGSLLFFDRDISWLSFNERVLLEATRQSIPLMERLRFISIFSSNLDEFYRVRIPLMNVLHKLATSKKSVNKSLVKVENVYEKVNQVILRQSKLFGNILENEIIPQFKEYSIHILYNEPIPTEIRKATSDYFFEHIASFLEIVFISEPSDFFPVNNKLYISVILEKENGKEEIAWVNIPSDAISRFFTVFNNGTNYIVFIDDIIKAHLWFLFPKTSVTGAFCIKITRDANLDLSDEFEGDFAERIEKQLAKRDFGLATRFLYSPGIPHRVIDIISDRFSLASASMVQGGEYHNLSNLADLPSLNPSLAFPKFKALNYPGEKDNASLFQQIQEKDMLIHTPYQGYNTILRFFNESAITEDVEEIYVTLYRIANDSRIAHALISAAKNGKKVTVFVEVKARFDELNNIRWGKKMKSAGVNIIYSIPELKVHAKVALIKLKKEGKSFSLGLFATGNLNEVTAGFYTDHILLTANQHMIDELKTLFLFLKERKKPKGKGEIRFKHLLIAQFNLQKHFLDLIENEIANSRKGLPAGITIKLNNLEEEVLITKLYKASQAGVKITLIVRSICRIIPGIAGMSENIIVKRIVGRFLEHGRIFIFCNGNNDLVFMGSADWMNRNIYRRIEVCFPIYDDTLRKEIKDIIQIQMDDNISAVAIDEDINNVPIEIIGKEVESQRDILEYLRKNSR